MIVVRSFAHQDVGVYGLARSGLASVKSLLAGGARLFAWDDKESARIAAESCGAMVVPWRDWPWEKLKAVVLSPGVPFTHPAPHEVVAKANAAAVKVVGDFELFAHELKSGEGAANAAPVIAVTGTNGKSTTTALIGHILEAAGHDVEIGGNIGRPALDLAPPAAKTVYVLEMSSYQIDLAPGFRSDVAVLTNISADHIDRHGSLEAYAAVKARLLEQGASGTAVIGVDDPQSAAIFTRLSASGRMAIPVSVGKVLGRGVFVLDGTVFDAVGGRANKIVDLSAAPRLAGAHNWQNAALAYAATRTFARDARSVAAAILDFTGLAHRMEEVGRIGRVRYINDSKATNADATERALVCFDDIYWIAGGRPKDGGIRSLARHFGRVRKAYLIGEAAADFAATLQGAAPVVDAGTLEKALALASADATRASGSAPVVLFSPACASFDQFRDFEHRGDVFRALVQRLMSAHLKEAS
ncbi:MAG TPA: UDP-N-acetylmuramoyl-L-alanine--D-glutamate ligase [Rhizomicrobium sp.]|nr:UDP-N-acetylmuramoyl-L-alanine--D-glutamate ligase [Rhizomicrobium sp.]